jgi:hypothetical protein
MGMNERNNYDVNDVYTRAVSRADNRAISLGVLPIKMYLRWAFNLKYIVGIPEFFFNI